MPAFGVPVYMEYTESSFMYGREWGKIAFEVKRGQIYIADLPKGKGSEQEGIRPVLIVQDDDLNLRSPTVIILVITSKLKKMNMRTHLLLPRVKGLPRQSAVFAEKIREIDRSRLLSYCDSVSEEFMRQVDRSVKAALGMRQGNRYWPRKGRTRR